MRIAFFHELSDGGARRSVREFGKELKKRHTVDLYFIDSQNSKDSEKYFSNVFYFNFNEKRWRGNDWKTKLYKDTVELYNLLKLHKKIALQIDQRNYDIVVIEPSRFTQAPFILKFLKMKKIYYCQEPLRMIYDPKVKSLQGVRGIKLLYEKFNRSLRKEIDKRNIAHADKVLANSKFTQKNIKKAYGIRADVCYMGVDTKEFKPLNKAKKIDVLYIGAYDPVDGMKIFDDAIKKTYKKLSAFILAREKKWIKNDLQLRDLYNSARITVCISRNEPFGLIPLESMACQTPVIALNEGGYRESIKNKQTGMLVNNSDELAKAMELLLGNIKNLKKIGENARKDMESNWLWSNGAKMIESYAEKLEK